MSEPKLHHYVPRFYLRRFHDESDRLWVWDRDADRTFPSQARSLAAERNFYYFDAHAEAGHDPLTMEKQLATLEGEVARITEQWIRWIYSVDRGTRIEIPEPNRELVSLFIGLQFLRTADARDTLARLSESSIGTVPTRTHKRLLHTEALWDDALVSKFSERVHSAIWMFGRSDADVLFVTSDNPVAFRTSDNSMWLKAGVLGPGTYVVYPLTPDIVMYCYPREEPWSELTSLDACVSPVPFSPEMVESENSGQVFMASRFVVSSRDDFSREREFAQTIGTDVYADYWQAEDRPSL